MATRLYGVATTAAPVSPAFDGGWQATTGAVRRSLSTTKAAGTETRASVAVTSGANNETLGFQLISDPVDAGSISGTVTIMTRGRELATTDNVDRRARCVYVVSGDGSSVRGVLLAQGFGAATGELGTTLAGYQAADAVSLSSVTAQQGDRVVVELGYGLSGTGTTPLYDMVIGGNGTDHANSDGDGTGTVPWVEFSQTLAFAPLTPQGERTVNGLIFDEYDQAGPNASAATTVVQGVYRMPAGSLGVVVAVGNGAGGAAADLALADAGGSWTREIQDNHSSGSPQGAGAAAIFTKAFASQTDITLTLTVSGTGASAQGHAFKVYAVKSGYDSADPVGAVLGDRSTTDNWTTTTLTPETSGVLFSGYSDWNANGPPTSSDLTEDGWDVAGQFSGGAGYKPVTAASATGVNWDGGAAAAVEAHAALLEIRKATTAPAVAVPEVFSQYAGFF